MRSRISMRLLLLGLVLIAAVIAAAACSKPTAAKPGNTQPAVSEEGSKTVPTATVKTNKGTFTITFYPEKAPKTVASFIKLSEDGFYNGNKVHRYEPNFVVQMGDPQTNSMTREDVIAGKNPRLGTGGPASPSPPSSTTRSTFRVRLRWRGLRTPTRQGRSSTSSWGPHRFSTVSTRCSAKSLRATMRSPASCVWATRSSRSPSATASSRRYEGPQGHVDQARFDEALKSYEGGDYRQAAKGFLSAAGRGTAGNGSAYHYAGNSLMRLRRWRDAVTVYGHALRDEAYTKRGAVFSNLGQAYTHLAEYTDAVDAYNHALEETDFTAKYKAHQGMAAAYLEMGKHEEAASEYRTAALDPANPDPGKALVNLGLCFMALNRPADAVESYKAALGFDELRGSRQGAFQPRTGLRCARAVRRSRRGVRQGGRLPRVQPWTGGCRGVRARQAQDEPVPRDSRGLGNRRDASRARAADARGFERAGCRRVSPGVA